jgi:hypothetical protein
MIELMGDLNELCSERPQPPDDLQRAFQNPILLQHLSPAGSDCSGASSKVGSGETDRSSSE